LADHTPSQIIDQMNPLKLFDRQQREQTKR
jgi:hypothetical protein